MNPYNSEDSKIEIAYQSKTKVLENRDRRPFDVLAEQAEGTAVVPLFIKGVLSQEEFIERLRLEKRRVDRSGNPLSLALFFLKERLLADARKLREFLVFIKQDTRKTDLKGWVNGSLGLLMLDTDSSGSHKCVDPLINNQAKAFGNVLTGTYPDPLFDEIMKRAVA